MALYIGSVQDFEHADKERVKDDIEFMTHPDFINGTLTDNTLPNPHPFVTRGWIEENGLYLEDTPGKKIKLLVCFIQAHIGGAMTSLVNFLNALDTDKYEADVMFYEKGAEPAELPFDDNGYFKFFTAARINFENKGLDRAVRVFALLRDDGLANNVKWVIAGKGRDAARLGALIKKHGLQDVIYPIGVRENPIPYMRLCDAMLLPSIHEGKPMAVTEGLIMGLVPIVTRYTSAGEQIQNGVDGLVFDNSEEALYKGLKSVLEHPECLREMREYIRAHDYGNEKEIKEFDKLTERLLK